MNEYLFLYPIAEYVDACTVHRSAGYEKGSGGFKRINQIIEARYRNKGYDVNWLLFSLKADNKLPDLGLTSPYFEIRTADRILNAEISFEDFVKNGVYPKPDLVLGKIPRHEKLVLGGFHQTDCVNRIAKASYERGVSTFVDEDTTEWFFIKTSLGETVPIAREKWSLKDIGIPDCFMEAAKDIRKDKPWLTQT
jgi:hypothetical protein